MQLQSFRVRKFRNVLDSNDVPVEPSATGLVGKNESGKTALLQALDALNSSKGRRFHAEDDYPRWLYARDRKEGVVEDVAPISATFLLDAEDKNAIDGEFGEGVAPDEVTIRRYYDGRRVCSHACNESKAVSALVKRMESEVPEGVHESISDCTSFDDLRDKLAEYDIDDDENGGVEKLRASIPERFKDNAARLIIGRMPEFFYFDEYSMMDGRVNLVDLASENEGAPAKDSHQAARSLLRLADTDLDALNDPGYELRKSELEAVSNLLTEEVFEYWSQNTDLAVYMDVDQQVIKEGKSARVERTLEIRVHDKEHNYTGNFEQRSSGFRWFFSFLAAFTQFEREDRDFIVLLDEPALALHGRAQADFLRFVDERLAPNVQVLYTTHSPFMVDMRDVERVRIVEDRGRDVGSKVGDRVLSTDPDSLFPLQAALGYDIAQNLFVGPNNLVVEGTSDYAYLTAMSTVVESHGREPLDPRWRILPVGGVTNIPSMVAFLGDHVDLTVLMDSGTPQTQRVEDQVKKGRLKTERIIRVADLVAQSKADIEDLFTPAEYLKLYNRALGVKVSVKELPPGQRIVDRINRHQGDFDHGKPAEELLRQPASYGASLSKGTIERWAELIQLINERMEAR